MLLSKVLKGKQYSRREIIGVIGAHPGAGVTYTALLLSFYFGDELGRKTALLECNNHKDMSLMQPIYEWSKEGLDSFSFGCITFFKEVEIRKISEILSDNYECCILDFGTDFENNRDELLRCGTKIIVGGQSDWNRQKLIRFIRKIQSVRGSDTWLYFIPYGSKKVLSGLSKEFKRNFYSVPLETKPTCPSGLLIRFFDKIFC